MGLLFKNDLLDQFGVWPLAYIPFGGLDFGEIQTIGQAVGDGDHNAYYDAWMAAGDRQSAEADEAFAKGRRSSARALLLRASCCYATSYHPLYGKPVDPRLTAAFRKMTDAFDKGLALFDTPVLPMRIPFENGYMPAYFIPAEGCADQVRPLLILTNGYDGTITDMYFASAVAASRRGYHCVLFDGPGQGGMLVEQSVPLRPDWEIVVKAVVDHAVTLPLVDPARIALTGWSLGGYLAPRAASGEHRLRACIADPGQWAMPDSFRGFAMKLGASKEAAANLGEIDKGFVDRFWQIIQNDHKLYWSIVQRGFWVHGVDNLRDYLRSAELFTNAGRAELIQCPTLLTIAEGDPLTIGTQTLFDAMRCPKAIARFSAQEGAGGHCEMGNRSLLNRRVLDWLDDVMTD